MQQLSLLCGEWSVIKNRGNPFSAAGTANIAGGIATEKKMCSDLRGDASSGVGSSLSKQFTCVFSGGEINVYGNLDAKAFMSYYASVCRKASSGRFFVVAVNGQFPRALHVFA